MRTCVIDVGTTTVRAVVYDDEKMLDFSFQPLQRKYPQPGFVELDPQEIYHKSKSLLDSAIEKLEIDAIAITNQRTTSVLWDGKSGKNLFPSLTWQDIRAKPIAESLNRLWLIRVGKILGKLATLAYPFAKDSKRIKYLVTISKLSFKPNHASVHLMWMLQNLPENAKKDELKFGTLDSWLLYNLCEEHSTDFTNASATGIYDIFFEKWSENILKIVGFPEENLPEIKPSDSIFGEYKGIPICSVVADQQASLFAQGCFEKGSIKCTNGTGTFVDLNVGESPLASLKGLIPMIAIRTKKISRYLLEGYVSYSGSSVEWMREIGLLNNPEESSELAFTSKDEDLLLVPSFAGLGTPHYTEIPAVFWGISNKTQREDFVKALLEAIAFRIGEIVGIMKEEAEINSSIKMDGKMSSNDFLLQRVADITGLKVERSRILEGSSYGAHLIAGLAMEQWGIKEIEFMAERSFERKYDLIEKFERWSRLVQATKKTRI
jgi:glycerol kinase